MQRRVSLALFTAAAFGLFAGRGYAQEANIKAALGKFHAAIELLDMSKMAPLWAHDGTVTLVNPRGGISVGWETVQKSWDVVPTLWSQLTITPTDGPYIEVKGDVARSMGMVSVVGKSKAGEAVNRPTLEVDTFEKRNGAWLLVSHAASGRQ